MVACSGNLGVIGSRARAESTTRGNEFNQGGRAAASSSGADLDSAGSLSLIVASPFLHTSSLPCLPFCICVGLVEKIGKRLTKVKSSAAPLAGAPAAPPPESVVAPSNGAPPAPRAPAQVAVRIHTILHLRTHARTHARPPGACCQRKQCECSMANARATCV